MANAGFRFFANTIANGIGVQVSDKDSNISPGAQTPELQVIRTSSFPDACQAALVNNNIGLAFECLKLTTCSANRAAIDSTQIGANNSSPVGILYLWLLIFIMSAAPSASLSTTQMPDISPAHPLQHFIGQWQLLRKLHARHRKILSLKTLLANTGAMTVVFTGASNLNNLDFYTYIAYIYDSVKFFNYN